MKYKKISLNQNFREPINKNQSRLMAKIKEAKERTRQWALGTEVEWPAKSVDSNNKEK
ncbi:MAG: hypothetical protein ACKKMS_00030 [Candidatus Nealsonbacteria bacterium]